MKQRNIRIILGLVTCILAVALTLQIRSMAAQSLGQGAAFSSDELRDSLLRWKERYEDSEKTLDKTTKELETIREESTEYNEEAKQKAEELKKKNMLLGLTKVTGDGVTIVVKDAQITNATEEFGAFLVHDGDLREIVSELQNAGAEAISINGERIVSSTCIMCAGNIISINGERVNSPFTIKAIGNQESLYGITRPGGYAQILKECGIPIEVKKENNIVIDKFSGALPQKYMKDIGGEE